VVAGFLPPGDREPLLRALSAQPADLCAPLLIEHAAHSASLDVVRLLGPAFEAWGDPRWLPDLYRLYGRTMLAPHGRVDDRALSAAEAIAALREAQGQPLIQVEWPDVREEWLGLAHDRFVTEWGVGALSAARPTEDERAGYIQLAGPAFEACLADPSTAPRDPFDPLQRSATASSELSVSTRCAAQAILETWVEHGTPELSANVRDLLGHYPNLDHWGPLALSLEAYWEERGDRSAALADAHRLHGAATPRRPLLLWGGLVATCALLAGLAWRLRQHLLRRAVVYRLGAVGFGLGLVVAAEAVLALAGVPPGDHHPTDGACSLDEFKVDEERRLLLDKRSRGVLQPRPEGARRVAFVGASTVAGPGLPFEQTLPGVLQRLLGDEAEVVALGEYGADARRVREWATFAAADLDAQLVVVYSGHNEVGAWRQQVLEHGLGPPAWWLKARGWARRIRLAGVVTALLGGDRTAPSASGQGEDEGVLQTHHPGFERRIAARFEVEVTDLVRAVRRSDAEVLLVQPSFNHHGLRVPPEVRATDPSRAERGQEAVHALAEGLSPRVQRGAADEHAGQLLARARGLASDVPEHPTAHLFHALAAENAGELVEAEAAVWEVARTNHGGSAVTPGVAGAIVRIARRHHVPLADAHAALHEASGPHLPGFGLYWDYVHFTAEGAEVVATEIAAVIEREGLLVVDPDQLTRR